MHSSGWLKCVTTKSGAWRRSSAASARVIRIGQVTGARVATPQQLHVRDGPQRREERVEPLVGEHQRVAARDDHVADLGVGAHVRDPLLDRVAVEPALAARR